MKKSIWNVLSILLLFLFSFSGKTKDKNKDTSPIIDLKFDDKSFVFSNIAKPGRVSIFILSTSWCAPCHALRRSFEEAFQNSKFSSKDLDVYYCSLSSDRYNNFEELNKNKGYLNFKEVDQLTAEFPTSYIVSPTTNCYTIISGNYPDSLFHIANNLIAQRKKYFSLKNLQWDEPGKKPVPQDGKLIDSLKNQVKALRDSIGTLNARIDSICNNSEPLMQASGYNY